MHALNGVTMSVEEGDFLAIVGTSGSGRTILLEAAEVYVSSRRWYLSDQRGSFCSIWNFSIFNYDLNIAGKKEPLP